MGVLLGTLFAAGVLLVVASFRPRPPRRTRRGRARELLLRAGIDDVAPGQLAGACAGIGIVAAVVVAGLSRVAVLGLAFGVLGGAAPVALLRGRARRRSAELRAIWPEIVDNLASAVRAGLALPEAVAALGARGPAALRPAFAAFAADYRATGRFGAALDRLGDRLADPTGDRVIEALRLAREVGGSDLGRLLRTLSAFLRDDLRTRAELEARQQWTVSAARLALVAPWVLLLLLSTRPEAVAAYGTRAGAFVLAAGGGVSLLAYRLMLRLGRLPAEQRSAR